MPSVEQWIGTLETSIGTVVGDIRGEVKEVAPRAGGRTSDDRG